MEESVGLSDGDTWTMAGEGQDRRARGLFTPYHHREGSAKKGRARKPAEKTYAWATSEVSLSPK